MEKGFCGRGFLAGYQGRRIDDRRMRGLGKHRDDAHLGIDGGVGAIDDAERAFAEMLERGEVIPARNGAGLTGWQPLPPRDDEASLSDLLIAMRDQERG